MKLHIDVERRSVSLDPRDPGRWPLAVRAGAVGISGDTGDNDEIIAVAGITAAGLKADPGGTKK